VVVRVVEDITARYQAAHAVGDHVYLSAGVEHLDAGDILFE
jgi:hypothetical protein